MELKSQAQRVSTWNQKKEVYQQLLGLHTDAAKIGKVKQQLIALLEAGPPVCDVIEVITILDSDSDDDSNVVRMNDSKVKDLLEAAKVLRCRRQLPFVTPLW